MGISPPQVVILAGGMGTRLSEETNLRPKPMVDIGEKPILWHIMKSYSHFGFTNFVICLGYKGYLIKEYFSHYFMHQSDVTLDLSSNKMIYHNTHSENWTITLADTGLESMTGARLKRIQKYITGDTFMMTYGDGVSDLSISDLLRFHQSHQKWVTLTAVQPTGKFGALGLNKNGDVAQFKEKIKGDGQWVNGGFFVLNTRIFDYIADDPMAIWEQEPLEKLSSEGQVQAYKHHGFWRPMDTLKDKLDLAHMVQSRQAPWMLWDR